MNPARLILNLLAFFGNAEANQRLRQDRLRWLEVKVFLDHLKPTDRALPMKKLRHKFERKFPL